jgi:hypothetical protein
MESKELQNWNIVFCILIILVFFYRIYFTERYIFLTKFFNLFVWGFNHNTDCFFILHPRVPASGSGCFIR